MAHTLHSLYASYLSGIAIIAINASIQNEKWFNSMTFIAQISALTLMMLPISQIDHLLF